MKRRNVDTKEFGGVSERSRRRVFDADGIDVQGAWTTTNGWQKIPPGDLDSSCEIGGAHVRRDRYGNNR